MLDKKKLVDALQKEISEFDRILQENQISDRSPLYKNFLQARWEAMQEVDQDLLTEIQEGKYDAK